MTVYYILHIFEEKVTLIQKFDLSVYWAVFFYVVSYGYNFELQYIPII